MGLLLPFIVLPQALRWKNVIFWVDNEAVSYRWQSGYIRRDRSATQVLKSVYVLSTSLGCTVYVQHVGRVSNEMATLADELSRKEQSSNSSFRQALEKAEFQRPEQRGLCGIGWKNQPMMERWQPDC